MKSFGADRRGSVVVVFALTIPVLAGAVGVAIEYGSLAARRSKLQSAADMAATTTTSQLMLSNTTLANVQSTAKSLIENTAPPPKGSTSTIVTELLDKNTSVHVKVDETIPSVFGKLLALPTMQLSVQATARITGTIKLCMLVLDPKVNEALHIETNSILSADGCSIQSNSKAKRSIMAEDGAGITATTICATGGVSARSAKLNPTPTTDCPAIPDPLATIARPQVGAMCKETDLIVTGPRTLYPGTYCGGITVSGTGQATVMPGIYVIKDGPLIVSETASLTGENVGFYFDGDRAGARIDADTTLNLTAPKNGEMVGMLFMENGVATAPVPPPDGPKGKPKLAPYDSGPMRTYRISSNNAPRLLGTIYLPGGRIVIDASKPVAQRSAYTVLVARQVDLNSGPNLFLNSDYGASDVPVPPGMRVKAESITLSN